MNRRGQVLILVAVLIPIMLLLVAVAVDAGRVFIERGRMRRAAGAAASAGISVIADRMVTQAAARQTEAAGAGPGPGGMNATATPPLDDPVVWLRDEDRRDLVSPELQAQASSEAALFLKMTGYSSDEIESLEVDVRYPQAGYDPFAPQITELRLSIHLKRRLEVLLAGLLNENWVVLQVEAHSQIPQR
jgi:hypothetical protein